MVKQSIWLLYSLILMHYSGWLNLMHHHRECPMIEILTYCDDDSDHRNHRTVGSIIHHDGSNFHKNFNMHHRYHEIYFTYYYKKNFLGLFGIHSIPNGNLSRSFSTSVPLSESWLMIASCIIIHAIRIFSFGFFVYSAIGSVIIKKLDWMEECRISHKVVRPLLHMLAKKCQISLWFHLLFLSMYLMQISCQVFCWEGSTLLEHFLNFALFGMFVLVLMEILIISLLRRVLRGSPEKPDEQ